MIEVLTEIRLISYPRGLAIMIGLVWFGLVLVGLQILTFHVLNKRVPSISPGVVGVLYIL